LLVVALDQNLIVLHYVLLPPIWHVAELVLGVDLADHIATLNLGSDHKQGLARGGLPSLNSILGHMSICSLFPHQVVPGGQHLVVVLLGMLAATPGHVDHLVAGVQLARHEITLMFPIRKRKKR